MGGGSLLYLQDFVSGSLYVNSDLHCVLRPPRSRPPGLLSLRAVMYETSLVRAVNTWKVGVEGSCSYS